MTFGAGGNGDAIERLGTVDDKGGLDTVVDGNGSDEKLNVEMGRCGDGISVGEEDMA